MKYNKISTIKKMTEKNGNETSKNILSYEDDNKQTVLKLFGIELTAPSGLKNPGIVYVAFIVINMVLFLILKSFISN